MEDYRKDYMRSADNASTMSTCDRRHVGCVIVKDWTVVGVGHNTAPIGTQTCDDVGHLMVDGSCKRTIHAEVNACIDALRTTGDLEGAIAYVTDEPCADCLKFIANLGISKVYYARPYHTRHYEFEHEVELVQVDYKFKW